MPHLYGYRHGDVPAISQSLRKQLLAQSVKTPSAVLTTRRKPLNANDSEDNHGIRRTGDGIIINAGQSRSLCYEALHAAKAGDFATADAKMQEAAHYSREAHLVQTQLIEADEGEEKPK